MSRTPVHSRPFVTIRLVRWYRTDDGWQSEVVRGRLLEHQGGFWRLLEGDVAVEYPDSVWSLCHE